MKKYIPYIISAALLLLWVNQCCENRNDNKRNSENLLILQDSLKQYKSKNGALVFSKGTLQLENKQLQDIILSKDKQLQDLSAEFSNVKSVIKYKTITRLDTITVVYNDSVPCVFDKEGFKSAEWYSFKWKSNQNGITIDSLQTWTSTAVITGVKRKWFLGKETVTTDITFSNPYIQTTELQSAEFVLQKPWYKKWWVWAIAGASGGVMIIK